ncbi:MAG: hypothetical protein H0T89_08590, partial [Deltaproteobacteria bacterium]|nr:hypothetical protein [Deltaproteobacteria bacterium]
TARHLLTADGHVPLTLGGRGIAAPVAAVELLDPWSGERLGLAGALPDAALRATRADDPAADCIWFPLDPARSIGLPVRELDRRLPAVDQPVFVLGAAPEGAFFTRWRHRAHVIRVDADVLEIRMADLSMSFDGLSGAPVVDADGRVRGLVVRGPGYLGAVACLTSPRLDALIAA